MQPVESGLIRVVANPSLNRITLSFVGVITPETITQHEAEIIRGLRSLSPGFTLVTNLAGLTSMDTQCAVLVERTMEAVRISGVHLIVRIVPNRRTDIGLNIMSLFHYPEELRIVTTGGESEAHDLLGNS